MDFNNYLLFPNCRERESISLTKYQCENNMIPVYRQIYIHDTEVSYVGDTEFYNIINSTNEHTGISMK